VDDGATFVHDARRLAEAHAHDDDELGEAARRILKMLAAAAATGGEVGAVLMYFEVLH
jgi:hypothetical protein